MTRFIRSLSLSVIAVSASMAVQAVEVTVDGASCPAPIYAKCAAAYHQASSNKANYISSGS